MRPRRPLAFRLRWAFGAVLVGPAVLLALLSTPWPSRPAWIAVSLHAAGWVVFVLGAAVRFWATLYVGGRKQRSVVADGPYSLCRHPLYVGSFLVALALGLFLESLVVVGAVALAAAAYARVTIPAEERVLLAALGEPYARYQSSVPPLLPRFAGYHSPATIEVDVAALRREARRAARWLLLPAAVEVLLWLRAMPCWPRPFHLP